jgi:MFS family permease
LSGASDADPPGGPARSVVLTHPAFGFFLGTRGLSSLAYQMQVVIAGWQLYALTNSTFMLGLAGLAQFLPMVLLTLPAGHVADRYDRRLVTGLALGLQALGMAYLSLKSAAHTITPADVFVAVGLIGAARSFERPASQALMPTLVPAELVPKAIAWGSSVFQSAFVVGPAVGGLLYGFGASVPYGTAASLELAAAVLLVLVRVRRAPTPREPATLRSVFSGIHFIKANPVILGSISLDLFAVLLGGATALLPAYARDILGIGVWGLGALRAAPALGSILMSVALVRWPIARHVGRRMFAAVLVFGAATIVFGFSRSPALSFVALLVLGAADMVSVVVRSSVVQLWTPDAMRGRVSAVNSLFIGTSNQLGEFESGVTASLLGVVGATVFGGVGTILVCLAWMKLFPPLLAVDRVERPPDESPAPA